MTIGYGCHSKKFNEKSIVLVIKMFLITVSGSSGVCRLWQIERRF